CSRTRCPTSGNTVTVAAASMPATRCATAWDSGPASPPSPPPGLTSPPGGPCRWSVSTPIRRLRRLGHGDAASQVGNGLVPTWGPEPRGRPALLTIDHILIDPRCAVLV